jgi:hypothetical protein
MKFDILGRIQNMRLPDGKTAILYSIYEAVSNSMHAIQDRFGEDQMGRKGEIEVDIETDDYGDVESISVTDNGIGFTDTNLVSFETSDSRYKYKRGGKGVGRFIWIKTFDRIMIDSVIQKGRTRERIRFRFMPEKRNSIAYKKVTPAAGADLSTTVTLSDLKTEQRGQIRAASYLKDLCLHFFPQYMAGTLPKITVNHDGEVAELRQFIGDRVEESVIDRLKVSFDGIESDLVIHHVYVDNSMPAGLKNSYLLTAHGRLVGDPVSVSRKFDLSSLGEDVSYVAVVSSPYLDERVDQERLSFRLNAESKKLLEQAILESAERFLSHHLEAVREKQRGTVERVLFEHPQLATQIPDLNEYIRGLSPDMDEEKIAQNLFVLLFRDEQDILDELGRLRELDHLTGEARVRAEKILEEATNQQKHRLAELVVKRHQVLEIASLLIKFKEGAEGAYEKEEAIHQLILPMGEMFSSGDLSDHNLWILDDTLSGYGFFASDKSIASLVSGKASPKEPDAVFFNPLGFRREGTDEPIVLVEFKRPGDERPSQDPLDQVLGYVDDLRGHKVTGVDGERVTDIGATNRFECLIVCELTPSTRRRFERSLAQNPTPDGEGYYGWSQAHSAYIRVISFKKMLRDAELRNSAFFGRLGLGSPSLRARERLARKIAQRDKIEAA